MSKTEPCHTALSVKWFTTAKQCQCWRWHRTRHNYLRVTFPWYWSWRVHWNYYITWRDSEQCNDSPLIYKNVSSHGKRSEMRNGVRKKIIWMWAQAIGCSGNAIFMTESVRLFLRHHMVQKLPTNQRVDQSISRSTGKKGSAWIIKWKNIPNLAQSFKGNSYNVLQREQSL